MRTLCNGIEKPTSLRSDVLKIIPDDIGLVDRFFMPRSSNRVWTGERSNRLYANKCSESHRLGWAERKPIGADLCIQQPHKTIAAYRLGFWTLPLVAGPPNTVPAQFERVNRKWRTHPACRFALLRTPVGG